MISPSFYTSTPDDDRCVSKHVAFTKRSNIFCNKKSLCSLHSLCYLIAVSKFQSSIWLFSNYQFFVCLKWQSAIIPFSVPAFLFFFAMMFFICLVHFCNSLWRLLAVCNIVEVVLCWCVVTVCINESSLLYAYSISLVTSVMYASSNCISPFLPCFLGTYQRSMAALWW